MVVTSTIFAALAAFFLNHGADIAGKMVASAGYDILKGTAKGLTSHIKGFFSSEKQAESFVEEICTRENEEGADPKLTVEKLYQQLTGNSSPAELLNTMKEWFEENRETLSQSVTASFNNTSGFNIGAQQAGGNINNIAGDYIHNDGKKDN